MDLNDYIKIFKRRFKIIAVLTVIGSLVFIWRANRADPLYTAVAKVLVNKPSFLIITADPGLAPETVDIETQKRLIKSTVVAERALELMGDTVTMPHAVVRWIRVVEEQDSGIINIAATTRDPEYSKTLANAFAEAYEEKSDVFTRETINRIREYIHAQINRLTKELEQHRAAIGNYTDSHLRALTAAVEGYMRREDAGQELRMEFAAIEDYSDPQRSLSALQNTMTGLYVRLREVVIESDAMNQQLRRHRLLLDEHNNEIAQLKYYQDEIDRTRAEIKELEPKLYALDDPSEDVRKRREEAQRSLQFLQAKLDALEGEYIKQLGRVYADHSSVERIRGVMIELDEERRTLLEEYTDQHPSVLAVDQRIRAQQEMLKARFREMTMDGSMIRVSDGVDIQKRILDLENGLTAVRARKASIEKEIAFQRVLVSGPSTNSTQQEVLQGVYRLGDKAVAAIGGVFPDPDAASDVQLRVRGLYAISEIHREKMEQAALMVRELQTLRVRLEETNLREVGQIKVKVIERAILPAHEVQRNYKEVILGAILGFAVGFLIAVLLENMIETIRTSDDVATYLDLPVIGTIPYATEADGKLVAEVPLRSAFAEAYKQLAFFVELYALEPKIKAVLFTSAKPNEGKTTAMANLGITLSQQGERVCLIDTDLRKPMLHRLFGLDNTVGVSTFLSGDLEADLKVSRLQNGGKLDDETIGELIDKIAQPTDYPGLSVITAGAIPLNSVELLKSQRFLELVEALKQRSDFVFFDSPPAIHVIDATVLASILEGVLLIISSNQVKREEAIKVRDMLESTKARILGVSLNNIDRESSEYYYHYSYYYQDKT